MWRAGAPGAAHPRSPSPLPLPARAMCRTHLGAADVNHGACVWAAPAPHPTACAALPKPTDAIDAHPSKRRRQPRYLC